MASERIDPGDYPGEPISLDHYARYAFAGQFASGKRVLDAACGLGYGSSYLRAAGATQVLGIDVAQEAILSAREHHGSDDVTFAVADVHHLSQSAAGPWDVIASFETIEHLLDPVKFIGECRAVLGLEGVLIASVPNDAQDPEGVNEFHIQRFNRASFEQLLRADFAFVEIVPQYFALASCINAGDHVTVGSLCTTGAAQSASAALGADEPECYVAVCGNDRAMFAGRSVLVHARKFWEHHEKLEKGKQWLEQQLANWQSRATELSADVERRSAHIQELEVGQSWLEEQRANWQRRSSELSAELERQSAYLKELEIGKSWLEEQRANWQRRSSQLSAELERQSAYVKELKVGKSSLEEQGTNWEPGSSEFSAGHERPNHPLLPGP